MKKHIRIVIFIACCSLFLQHAATAQDLITTTGEHTDYDTVYRSYKTYSSLEEALKDPLNVQKLDLSLNQIKALSPEIAQLKNLVYLDLSFNIFSTLPPELAALTKLEYLSIRGTRYMAKVPAIVSSLPALKILDIGDHPEWPAARFTEARTLVPKVILLNNK